MNEALESLRLPMALVIRWMWSCLLVMGGLRLVNFLNPALRLPAWMPFVVAALLVGASLLARCP